VSDATNNRGEPFGLERLQQVLQQNGDDHLEFLEQIFTALQRFGTDDPPVDDCTAIVLDFHSFWHESRRSG
ncbi:MAG TPA: hypothetical protein VD811_07960, partial [Desulfuromonadales bacterium]|nr:hypothetical protein [Desulfuromonadales bacterium]